MINLYRILGNPRKTGQLEDSHRDLKCRKARPRWLRIQKPEALMLQSVPPYVDTRILETCPKIWPSPNNFHGSNIIVDKSERYGNHLIMKYIPRTL